MSEPRVLRVSVSDGWVGQLRELDDVWSFEYDDAWLRNPLESQLWQVICTSKFVQMSHLNNKNNHLSILK